MKKTNDYYGTLYLGIAMNVKPVSIMGPIWGVTMNAKSQRLLWDPICRYCNEWKINDYYGTLYASIAMNEKPVTIMGPYMQVLQWMKNQWLLWDPICGYCNECKNQWLLQDLICGYCTECKWPRTIAGPYMRVLHWM